MIPITPKPLIAKLEELTGYPYFVLVNDLQQALKLNDAGVKGMHRGSWTIPNTYNQSQGLQKQAMLRWPPAMI